MNLRSITYWLVCCTLAFVATHVVPAQSFGSELAAAPASIQQLLPVQDPRRTVPLFLGVLAMAFTYRRAWLNWKNIPAKA